jgi:hypothetical protein
VVQTGPENNFVSASSVGLYVLMDGIFGMLRPAGNLVRQGCCADMSIRLPNRIEQKVEIFRPAASIEPIGARANDMEVF